jgi:DNA-binding transcriptional MerR regulator
VFTIGEFSGLTGVSAKKLRHYDGIGLFRPAWVDPRSSYRYYLATQIPQLQRIVALRDLGIPLGTVAALVEDGGSLHSELVSRRRQILEEKRRLERRLAALEIRIDEAEGMDVVVRTRPAGRWASLRRTVTAGDDLGDLFLEVETVVREAGARARRPPVAIGHSGNGRSLDVEILIPVSRRFAPVRSVKPASTSSTLVATTLHRGGYPALFEAGAWAPRWAGATGHVISGPAWVVYLGFAAEPELGLPPGFLASDPADYVTEVQVPLRSDPGG